MPLSPNMRGALFMIVAMAGFTVNDAVTKGVSGEMNLGQIMFVRGAFATLLVGCLAWHNGALRSREYMLHPLMWLRVLGELGGTIAFLVALVHMPLANVSAVLQSLPLAVTMGAALVLREPVGWRRWIAILIGFAGVLVVVRPGLEGFSVYSLYALLCVACCAVRDLATRRLPPGVPSLLVSTATAIGVTAFGGLLIVPLGGWTPMAWSSTGELFLASLLLVVGYHFIVMAMRLGDISFVAPFRYTSLLWAMFLGWAMFGEVPDGAMLAGSAVIVASGIYTLYRERVRDRTRPAAESTTPSLAPDGT